MTKYGYAIYENYLITISYGDIYYSYDNSMNNYNILYSKYYTRDFNIVEIEDIINNEIISPDTKIWRKIINVTIYLDKWIDFWKTKEIPYNKLLYKYCVKKNKDINKNICGYYKTYHDNGNIQVEFFHINGIKNGLFKEYYNNGQLKQEIYYINGEKMLQN